METKFIAKISWRIHKATEKFKEQPFLGRSINSIAEELDNVKPGQIWKIAPPLQYGFNLFVVLGIRPKSF